MPNIWSLQLFWTIFIRGELQIINVSSNTFIHFNQSNIFSGYFKTITIFYIALTILIIFVFLIAFLIKFITINANLGDIGIKEKLIETAKRFGTTMLILIFMPIIMYATTILLDFILSSIFIGENAIIKPIDQNVIDNFMKQLYSIGSNQNGVFTNLNDFSYPADAYLSKYNYFVQIVVIYAITFSYLYLMWTYFQKLLEIFILFITAPIAGVFAFSDDDLKIKLWVKEIRNKMLSMLMVIIVYVFYNYLIMQLINVLYTNNINYDVRYVLAIVFSVALFIVVIITVNLFNKKNQQYKGIIKSIRSLQDTIKYNFVSLNNTVKESNVNSEFNRENSKYSHTLIEQVKQINQKMDSENQNIESLKKQGVF